MARFATFLIGNATKILTFVIQHLGKRLKLYHVDITHLPSRIPSSGCRIDSDSC